LRCSEHHAYSITSARASIEGDTVRRHTPQPHGLTQLRQMATQ
jgi:hypothetical protein